MPCPRSLQTAGRGVMHQIALTDSQKNVVRRYVEVWRRWRPGIRGFAELERDLENGTEMLVDGISVDNRPGFPVIAADARDQRFHAAMFNDDDDALDRSEEHTSELQSHSFISY